jgi:hypothetical protein
MKVGDDVPWLCWMFTLKELRKYWPCPQFQVSPHNVSNEAGALKMMEDLGAIVYLHSHSWHRGLTLTLNFRTD